MASTPLYSEALDNFCQSVLARHKDSDTRRLLNDFLADGKSNFSNPGAARQAAAQLATDAGEKYNGIKIGKVEVVPKKWVDTVLGNIDSIVVAGSFMMKNAPESVGVAWFAISLTLKAISNNYSLYALFGTGLTDITEVMVIITHYDRLYDQRQKSGFKVSPLVDKLFRETIAAYAAVLDFSFSVKKHMSGKAIDKLRHGIKDFFNTQASKFQGKLSNIADLKGKIIESSQGAFQDKMMQEFEGVQSALGQIQERQSESLELQQEQTQVLTMMLDDFRELKDLVKRKTPWDFLKDDFAVNKKNLGPLLESRPQFHKLLNSKQDGTCTWILEDEKYQAWTKSDKSTMLCILGGSGSGKSVLLASLVERFEMATNAKGPFINYVSCVIDDNLQATALGEQKLSRVCNTLLYQLYELAIVDSDRISLLETCNQVFKNPKSRKAGPTSGHGVQDDGPPNFVDAMKKLVTALQYDTIIIIDAVSNLNQEDQTELYNDLQELISDPAMKKISILIGSRSDSTFIQRSLSATACIDVSKGCSSDREAVLDVRLRDLSGWLDAERQLAKDAVLAKAGSRFDYIDDVALPFLRQPFQRPVSKYLRRLPGGLNESFEQAIRSMPQNYLDLLQLTVTWCLLSPRPVIVKEIVEAYSGIYTITEDSNISADSVVEDAYNPYATSLEIQQIIQASGPFLMVETNDDGQTVVKLQDAAQVRKFCDHSAETRQVHSKEMSHVCENCESVMSTRSSLAVDPKVAHMEIALTLLRHLNNPLFQKRFDLLRDVRGKNTESDSQENGVSDTSEIAPETPNAVEGSNEDESDKASAEQRDSEEEDSEVDGEKDDSEAKDDEDADKYTEPSIDGDFDDQDWINNPSSGVSQAEADGFLQDYLSRLRCEIGNWPYHLREAEKLWSLPERKNNKTWTQLNRSVQDELKKFADNQQVYYNWQKTWGKNLHNVVARGELKPLHLAAFLGLSSWVEDLLDNGADINEISGDTNVAQASGLNVRYHKNVELLHLLLSRGANFYEAPTEDGYLAAFPLWLLYCNNAETVKTFVDHGADFDTQDRDGWTGLHIFAWKGTDVESFIYIMNPKDPSKRPNINAVDNDGETPLHRLLWRREVPLDLLKAFLAIEGIDVNRDNDDSQQPLGVSSYWGSLEVTKLLLEANADVADTDNMGNTALFKAALGNHVRCLEALLDAHSEMEHRDRGGSTALQYAAYHGRKAAVELLVSKGAAINTTNNHNRTPFFNATRSLYGTQETAQYLLDELKKRGYSASDINMVTKGRRTPLRQAAAHGFAQVVEDLLNLIEASGDDSVRVTINQGDEKLNRTPLHCAAQRGESDCVRLLLKHGADATSTLR